VIGLALAIVPALGAGARADGPGATAPGATVPATTDLASEVHDDASTTDAPDQPDQAIAATLGAAAGGRVTPGGLRVGGRYLYQMSEADWFEGHVAITFGRGGAACFRDRDDAFVCDHGKADGFSGEIGGAIRRRIVGAGRYQPFVRAGIAARLSRFGSDGVTGLVFPVIAAGGVRAAVSDTIAISAEAALEFGIGFYNHGLGTEPQLGLAIAGVVEFAL